MTEPGPIRTFPCALLAAALGCGPRGPAPVASTPLGGDAAHVGSAVIPTSLVVRVARSQGADARSALGELVEDALLAQEAHARGLDRDGSVRWECTSALARAVSRRLLDDSRQRGAPTNDELDMVRVIHAVVLKSSNLPPLRAEEIAGAIEQAVASAKSEDEFETRARQVPHSDAKVRVERLEAFDASGSTPGGDVLDPSFVAAAFELHARGQTSDVVPSPYGWHVIRLIERSPPDAATLEQRRKELATDVEEMRVRASLRDLLDARRRLARPEVSPAADELMTMAANAR